MDNLLTQERIDKIFRDRPTADEKREMAEFHRPIYIRLLIMNIPLLIIVIMAIANFKPYYLFLIGVFLLFDAYLILKLKITPVLARKRYIKMVNKSLCKLCGGYSFHCFRSYISLHSNLRN